VAGWWLPVLLLGVLPLAGVTATPLHADLAVLGGSTFLGDADATVQWAGSVADARIDSAPALGATSAAGAATLRVYRYAIEEIDPSTPTGYNHWAVPYHNESQPLGAVQGEVVLSAFGPSFSLRFLPDAPVALPLRSSFALSAPLDLHRLLSGPTDAQRRDADPAEYPPAGSALSSAGFAPNVTYAGRLFLMDVAGRVGGMPFDARWSSQRTEAPGVASATNLETRVLVVRGDIAVALRPDGNWSTVVTRLDGPLDGDLALSNARGSAAVNGSAASGVNLFQARGPMVAHAALGGPSSAWTLDGDVDFVAVDAATVAGQRWPAIAVRAAAGLGILAVLGAALRLLLGGRNVAEPASNPKRLEILGIVSREPGITLPQVARAAHVRRSTARHHLNVLLRGQLVTRRASGNAGAFTLNNATFDFPVPGAAGAADSPGVLAGDALGRFAQPVRRAILEALEALAPAPASLADLRAHWEARGQKPWSRTLVSYHCNRLLEDGLLARDGAAGGTARWSLRIDRPALLRHQRAAYARQGSFAALLEAAATPATAEELRARLAARGQPMPARQVERATRILQAVGFLRATPNGYIRAL
jgi:DNA-binding transcriptional ArsR family regulator